MRTSTSRPASTSRGSCRWRSRRSACGGRSCARSASSSSTVTRQLSSTPRACMPPSSSPSSRWASGRRASSTTSTASPPTCAQHTPLPAPRPGAHLAPVAGLCRVCAPRTCCAVLHMPRAAIAPGARGRREGHHRHPFYAHRAAEQVPQPRLQRPARRGSMLGLEPLP